VLFALYLQMWPVLTFLASVCPNRAIESISQCPHGAYSSILNDKMIVRSAEMSHILTWVLNHRVESWYSSRSQSHITDRWRFQFPSKKNLHKDLIQDSTQYKTLVPYSDLARFKFQCWVAGGVIFWNFKRTLSLPGTLLHLFIISQGWKSWHCLRRQAAVTRPV
jgi:hypothetical protein